MSETPNTILHVDDDDDWIEIFQHEIASAGIDVELISVATEEEALAIIAKNSYRLRGVITNLSLTGHDGRQGANVAKAAVEAGIAKVVIHTAIPINQVQAKAPVQVFLKQDDSGMMDFLKNAA